MTAINLLLTLTLIHKGTADVLLTLECSKTNGDVVTLILHKYVLLIM